MTNSPRPGRNEPCPCGSGRKFKLCCQGKTASSPEARSSPTRYVVMAVVGIGVVIVLGKSVFGPPPAVRTGNAPMSVAPAPVSSPAATTAMPGAGAAVLPQQPPGPAPEGKVWSSEHGHWHDAPAPLSSGASPAVLSGSASTNAATVVVSGAGSGALTPQPPGPVPEGKVWSPEHGHWHDAPPTPASPPAP